MRSLLSLAFGVVVCAGCDTIVDPPITLGNYVTSSLLPHSDQLIACAGGGEPDSIERPDAPISIYYYPTEGAHNFRYFETTSIDQNPDNLDNFREKALEDAPFFNGYLRRFRSVSIEEEKWARVSFETHDSLHVSNAIRLKYPVLPTHYDSSLVIVDADGVNPTFSWHEHDNPLDVIFFQVVSDRNGNLISGTYTFEKQFTFYQLDNVVLNIRDVSPAPMLELGAPYTFTLMTVSSDNWVNLIGERNFIAE